MLIPRPPITVILSLCCFLLSSFAFNLSLPNQHPFPEDVVQELHRRVNASLSRRQTLESHGKLQFSCGTGNPIDDCWRCDPNWANNRQQLAECAIGFGYRALGGKGGPYYVVTDPSDPDPDKPRPGTLRDAVSQPGPVWILFSSDMGIKLRTPLKVTSFKTIDGRGVHVEITGGGCVSVEHVTNVIIHNIHIHGCYPADNSDGDGIHVFASSNVWVDHCVLSNCADGLIDCTMGSTGITISNSYFSHHDKVMLLGHSDEYSGDRGMQVTVAFNRFGVDLVQRMPRCRFGYFHIVNNDYTSWGDYAVGGSSMPTINSQGNRYIAPINANAKEVTRRIGDDWQRWNWRTEGDLMVNGAFFVPSGDGLNAQYYLATSFDPKSAAYIDQLTFNAGLLLPNGGKEAGMVNPASKRGAVAGNVANGNGGYYSSGGARDGGYYGGGGGGWVFSNASTHQSYLILPAFLIILTCYFFTSHYTLFNSLH